MSFSSFERQLLLATPRLGPQVIQRLESIGICSIRQLRDDGVDAVIAKICAQLGSDAWANRRRALRSVLERAAGEHP